MDLAILEVLYSLNNSTIISSGITAVMPSFFLLQLIPVIKSFARPECSGGSSAYWKNPGGLRVFLLKDIIDVWNAAMS